MKKLDVSDKKELSRQLLSPIIKLLGDMLGKVIIEQSGKALFDKEEEIRLCAKQFRENNNKDALLNLIKIVGNLSPHERSAIIKSFSLFFQLVNLAEETYTIYVNDLERSDRKDTIDYLSEFAVRSKISSSKIIELMQSLSFKLVWTAHPTEARRLTNMNKLRKIYTIIQEVSSEQEGSSRFDQLSNQIKEQITLLWQSDDLRESKVEILDEVRTNLFYFDKTIFKVLPQLIRNLRSSLSNAYGHDFESLPNFMEFGSWVGGDRDGHPGVTAEITIQTLLLQKRLCLRNYIKDVKSLIQDLSSSSNVVSINNNLQQSINHDSIIFEEFASLTSRLNRVEPYRRKLDFIRIRLENTLRQVESSAIRVGLGQTLVGFEKEIGEGGIDRSKLYQRSQDFLNDLELISTSLQENKGKIIADGELATLIIKVQIFGFHLAPLDLRQHSKTHHNTLEEIFQKIGIFKTYEKADFDNKKQLLLREINNPRPLGVLSILDGLSEESLEMIRTLNVVNNSLQDISPRSIQSYIISMTRDEIDILVLMLLMKESNLVEVNNEKVDVAYLDIVPLFETKEDLDNAPNVMRSLFSEPLYRSYLELRGDVQEIMIGYSDSTKDVGFFQSNYTLLNAQINLLQVANEFGIKLKIFHGRGGSISRGGGSTYDSILSQPPGTLFRTKITEQGEVVGSKYSNPKIAYRHMEQAISGMVVRSIRDTILEDDDNPATVRDEYLEQFKILADWSSETYETLVKANPHFVPFYLEFTPLDLIERATIGSRPSRRTSESVSEITALRAIPWIFSWMQSRLVFPAYFGAGTALEKYKEQYGIEKLNQMYSTWPYFASLINNLQMVCTKVDLDIALQYKSLISKDTQNADEIFNRIRDEFAKSKNLILEITETSTLLEKFPDIQTSIMRRNPYIDPLSIIQVCLLDEWRQLGRPEDLSPDGIQRALLQTVNGIAAGLRNTG